MYWILAQATANLAFGHFWQIWLWKIFGPDFWIWRDLSDLTV